jgi:hypothetical protein
MKFLSLLLKLEFAAQNFGSFYQQKKHCQVFSPFLAQTILKPKDLSFANPQYGIVIMTFSKIEKTPKPAFKQAKQTIINKNLNCK